MVITNNKNLPAWTVQYFLQVFLLVGGVLAMFPSTYNPGIILVCSEIHFVRKVILYIVKIVMYLILLGTYLLTYVLIIDMYCYKI